MRFFLLQKNVFFSQKKVFYVFFFFISMKYMSIDGYGNDFIKLFYNTDLTSIKLIIRIGCLYNEL